MKFKGNIIITDPCYIMKNDDWSSTNHGSQHQLKRIGITKSLIADTEYGDWSCTTVKDDPMTNDTLIFIDDIYDSLWEAYNNGPELNRELIQALTERRKNIIETSDVILGEFCADSGMVGVFLLDEVLAYNPDFDNHINKKWTTTLIENFDGEIEITHRMVDGSDEREVSVVGIGNVNFYTTQTGF